MIRLRRIRRVGSPPRRLGHLHWWRTLDRSVDAWGVHSRTRGCRCGTTERWVQGW